jgi:hypothetical protein
VAGVLIGASALAAATLGAGAIAGAQDAGSAGPADAEAPAPAGIEELKAAEAAFEAFDRCVAEESGVEFEAPVEGDASGVVGLAVADAGLGELPAGVIEVPAEDLDLSEIVEMTDAELDALGDGVAIEISADDLAELPAGVFEVTEADLGEFVDGIVVEVDADDPAMDSAEAVEIADDPELAEMLEALDAAHEECAPLLPEGAGVAMIGSDGAVVEFGEITPTEAAPQG